MPFIRFTMRVRSPTRLSRSRFGRLASSSSSRRDRGHAAVAPFAAQPAEEGALEQLGVEPVGLGPPVLPRDGDARRVDDVGLDAARPQPARQPEAVAAGLEGDADARDRAAGPGRLVPSSARAAEAGRPRRPRASSAGWRSMAGTIPATSQLDWLSSTTAIERAVLLQGDEASAQVVRLRHGALRRFCQRRSCLALAARPIASLMRGLATAFPCVRPGLPRSASGRRTGVGHTILSRVPHRGPAPGAARLVFSGSDCCSC